MIGTMYHQHSLPKAYGGSYGRPGKSSSGSAVTTIAMVVLVVISGGLSLGYLSAQSRMRDVSIQHEAVSEELTYTKNHLHHVEAQLASREIDYQHLQAEAHECNNQQTRHELETLRQQKRQLDQSLQATNDQISKLKQELETTNALIEAYKQHLSDEVASHHQREENWLHIQEDWERLEKEMENEINTLRAQLQIAKLSIPANVHEHHQVPQHMNPEPVKHDPIYDHLPPSHIEQQQHVASPVPVHQVASPSPVPAQQPAQAAAVPTPVPAHGQPVQQMPAQPNGVPVQQVTALATVQQPGQQQHQQQNGQAPVPPQPPTPTHYHHDPHYEFHHETNDHETNDWHPKWHQEEYNQYFDHNNHYADYPGWVDDQPQQHGHEQHHAGSDNHSQHQQEVVHAGDWHHHDDSHHFHADAHQHHDGHQQQQQQHVAAPAQAATQQQHPGHAQPQGGTWQHQQPPAPAQQQHQHHGSDDLSMKLGMAQRHR